MEYLQYFKTTNVKEELKSFKPCYKWNTFNTFSQIKIPYQSQRSFKPCYKWNTFNTIYLAVKEDKEICFKPCYKWNTFNTEKKESIKK